MSRYPFDEYAASFLDSIHGVYSEDTFVRYRRRLRRMSEDLRRHYSEGMISTTSPKLMTEADVRCHLLYRRGLGYSQSEYGHEVTAFSAILDFAGNPALRNLLRLQPAFRPTKREERLPVLSDSEYDLIVSHLDVLCDGGLLRLASAAELALFLGAGCRTKELRLLERSDLDTESWVLTIRHVKGEDTYGQCRRVPIPPEFRSCLLCYMHASEGVGAVPLFFQIGGAHGLHHLPVHHILKVRLFSQNFKDSMRTRSLIHGHDPSDRGLDGTTFGPGFIHTRIGAA